MILLEWIKESGSKPERDKAVTVVVEQCAFCIQLFELGQKAKLRQCSKVCGPINFIHLSFHLPTSVSTSFSSCPIFHQTLDLNSSDTSHSIPDCPGSTITCWQLPLHHGKKWNTLGPYHNYFDLLLFWQMEHLSRNKAVWKTKEKWKQNPKNKEGNRDNASGFKFGWILFFCLCSSQLCSQYNCVWRGLPEQIKQCQGTSPRAGTWPSIPLNC